MQEIRMSFFISMEEIWKHIFMWLRGRVRGCADVFVAVRMCLWLRGRVRDRWPKTGTGGRGLSGLGQRCGELIANCD